MAFRDVAAKGKRMSREGLKEALRDFGPIEPREYTWDEYGSSLPDILERELPFDRKQWAAELEAAYCELTREEAQELLDTMYPK